ncbi:hypothetical protein [Catenulispora pinisilvae]|uniref:hypothetical protein n=1 Tax=Catenulispora pinisilvae TaxID=2705253 RepID=UPI0018921D1B|nr:hypothetical protein [Catenulispora pinisilvae]
MGRPLPDGGPSGPVSAIDVGALSTMISKLTGSVNTLIGDVGSLMTLFNQAELDTSRLTTINGVANSMQGQLPMLNRRLSLAQALERIEPGTTTVGVPEPVTLTSQQASNNGSTLADQFLKSMDDSDDGTVDPKLLAQLLQNAGDPDFAKGFYDKLGPQGVAMVSAACRGETNAGNQAYDQEVLRQSFATYIGAKFAGQPPASQQAQWNKWIQQVKQPNGAVDPGVLAPLMSPSMTSPDDTSFLLAYGDLVVNHGDKLDLTDMRGDGSGNPFTQDGWTAMYNAMAANPEASGQFMKANWNTVMSPNYLYGPGPNQEDPKSGRNAAFASMVQAGTMGIDAQDPALSKENSAHLLFDSYRNFSGGDWKGQNEYSDLTPILTQLTESPFNASTVAQLANGSDNGKQFSVFYNDSNSNYANVPSGAQDANILKLAVQQPGWAPSRQLITDTGGMVNALKADPLYLQQFYADGGAALESQVAAALHVEDGTHGTTVLSKDSEAILANYGAGLAGASLLVHSGQLPPNTLDPISAMKGGPENVWSASMLLKYGPQESPTNQAWDPKFLQDCAGNVLQWRANQQMRPSWDPPMLAQGFVGAYMDGDNAWYKALGLNFDHTENMNLQQQGNMLDAINANDPSQAVLAQLAGSKQASQSLLMDSGKVGNLPAGQFYADQLLSDKWMVNGDDEGQNAAAVIKMAMSNPSDDPKLRAAIAAEIFTADSANATWRQTRNDNDKSTYTGMPPSLAQSLAGVAGSYVPDMASGVTQTNPRTDAALNPVTGLWQVYPNLENTKQVIADIYSDKDASTTFNNAMAITYKFYAQNGSKIDPSTLQDDFTQLGQLSGVANEVGLDNGYNNAVDQDAQAQAAENAFNAITGAYGNAPLPLIKGVDPLGWSQALLGAVSPYITQQYFHTDHAANYTQAAQGQLFTSQSALQYPIAVGLANIPNISPSPDPNVFVMQGGQWTLKQNFDQQAYSHWWSAVAQNPKYANYLNWSASGFTNTTATRNPNSGGLSNSSTSGG